MSKLHPLSVQHQLVVQLQHLKYNILVLRLTVGVLEHVTFTLLAIKQEQVQPKIEHQL